MKLAPAQIERLAAKVADRLKTRGLLTPAATDEAVRARVASIVSAELQMEDALDDEVRRILEGHRRDIEAGRIDYNKMFSLIKKKLAEERNIVL